MSATHDGFLHISDLLEIQLNDPIFHTPENPNDVPDQMRRQIQDHKGVAFDLRLGDEYYLSGEDHKRSCKEDGGINIKPGQFALLTTYEIFSMPINLVAFLSMRFSVKAEGLINVSGFQVDPGYQGVFIFSVYNAGPNDVDLIYKKELFTIVFAKTSQPIPVKRNEIVREIPFDKWTKLRNKKNLSLIGLDEKISQLESSTVKYKAFIPILLGTLSAMVALVAFIVKG